MGKIRKISIIALTALMTLTLDTGHSLSADSNRVTYTATCDDPTGHNEYFKKKCTTDAYERETEIWCGAEVIKCPDPVCAEPPQVGYRCNASADNKGGNMRWLCKGWIGTSMDNRDDQSFTDEEFNDTQTRCSRYCGECRSGWK